MCQNIYISSQRKLPEIPWNKSSPGFYILKVTDPGTLEMLRPILPVDFVYEARSFMGCSCGLFYNEEFKKDPKENYVQRVRNARDFMNYLNIHKYDNQLQIFSSMWNSFPDQYERKDFATDTNNEDEFDIEEMVIFTLSDKTN